jgi:hypothetical protein
LGGRVEREETKTERRAIGYIRVSTADQADHGVSLGARDGRVRDWCATNGYALGEVFVERALSSGRADNRPAVQDTLAATRRGDALAVYSLSRLARSTRVTQEITSKIAEVDHSTEELATSVEQVKAISVDLSRLAEPQPDHPVLPHLVTFNTQGAVVALTARPRCVVHFNAPREDSAAGKGLLAPVPARRTWAAITAVSMDCHLGSILG